jgi:hypothetical protein
MPRISAFYGIVITMYFEDHNPPHFHARYADSHAAVALDDLALIVGELPNRALRLVREWAALHHDELESNWRLAFVGKTPVPIDPLP